MKIVIVLTVLMITVESRIHVKTLKKSKRDRSLFENLTTSYLLGDTAEHADTSHLSLLVSQ